MSEPFTALLLHMSPALVMGTLLLINLGARRGREQRREALDARRQATALATELASLRDSYNENLDLIAAGSPFLVSTRQSGAVYRATLARSIASLQEAALAPVVAAFAHQQRLESYLSACTKPNGAHGVTMLPRLTKLQELKRRYVEGIEAVEQALAALAPPEPAAAEAPRRPGFGWLRRPVSGAGAPQALQACP